MCSNEEKRLALVSGECRQSRAEILEVEMALLIRVCFEPRGIGPIRILDFMLALAVIGVEEVAQDRKQPRIEVRAGFELVDVGPGAQDRLLHQIVSPVADVGEGDGKGTEARESGEQLIPQRRSLNQHAAVSLSTSRSHRPASSAEEIAVAGANRHKSLAGSP
jgi:hypothetical protein